MTTAREILRVMSRHEQTNAIRALSRTRTRHEARAR